MVVCPRVSGATLSGVSVGFSYVNMTDAIWQGNNIVGVSIAGENVGECRIDVSYRISRNPFGSKG